MKQKYFYFFSAFVCGAAVMAVEMSGTRLLAPYFGTSLFVWTNVIAVILVSMALGYWWGGRMADRHPQPQIFFFWIAVTGAWVALIPFVAPHILPLLSRGLGSMESSLRLGSFIAVLMLLAFPMVLLGMVTPFTVRLTADKIQNIGSLSGKISTISTVGSLVGTFLPAFVLIPELGTTKTFVFIGLTLFFLAAFGVRSFLLGCVGLLATLLFWFVPPVYASELLIDSTESPYGYVFVTEDEDGVRYMHLDNALGIQSVYDPSAVLSSGRFYYGYFGLLPSMLESPKKVLILGHAGGSFTRIFNTYYPELEITGVELDPAVTALAMKDMGLAEATVNIVHADARQFLLDSEEDYDLILVDTYHGANIPAHMVTQEFFSLAHEHLTPGGILALNAASDQGPFLDELTNTVAEPFESVFSFQVPGSFNTMLLARDSVDFVPAAVPEDLQSFEDSFLEHYTLGLRFYQKEAAVFVDDKLSEVELMNEEMFMRLLSNFQ